MIQKSPCHEKDRKIKIPAHFKNKIKQILNLLTHVSFLNVKLIALSEI